MLPVIPGGRRGVSQEKLLEQVAKIAREAGAAILDVYSRDFEVRDKADASPVTEADLLAEALIVPALSRLTTNVPVISEEAHAQGLSPAAGRRFWLVDPLDGTKEFVSRNGEFTVNIALVEAGRPVLGAVLAPAIGTLYAGTEGAGAYVEDGAGRRPISCRRARAEGLVVVSSRSHGDAEALDRFLAGRRVASSVTAGSSLKFCLVAKGEADLYPRLGRTMEWDTAAGHAVLAAAGGRVTDLSGAELLYGKPGFSNPHFVASCGEC
jgi:3'(2'), 5'-bisphosphate nucleotidase